MKTLRYENAWLCAICTIRKVTVAYKNAIFSSKMATKYPKLARFHVKQYENMATNSIQQSA